MSDEESEAPDRRAQAAQGRIEQINSEAPNGKRRHLGYVLAMTGALWTMAAAFMIALFAEDIERARWLLLIPASMFVIGALVGIMEDRKQV